MQQFRSYLDTSLRVIHINRHFSQTEDVKIAMKNYIEESESSRPIRHEMIQQIIINEHNNNPELNKVFAHEFHHYLQGLFYPFLYYISWLEFDNLLYLGTLIREDKKSEFLIQEIHMGDEFSKNTWFLYQQADFAYENRHLVVKPATSTCIASHTLTLNDLLEDATSIFEYHSTTANPNAEDYFQWQNNPSNNCYKKTYRLLLKFLGKQKAFDLLPLCVQVGFTCTEPYTGFCIAINFITIMVPDYRLYKPDELFKLTMAFLEKNIGVVKLDPENHYFINEMPVGIIRYEDMDDVINKSYHNPQSLHYPLSIHLKKLKSKIEDNPSYQTKILSFERAETDELFNDFEPFAVHYHFKEFDGRNGALVFGNDFGNQDSPLGVPYRTYIRELIKIKESHYNLLTRSFQDFDNLCHHANCDYFDLGLCKFWNSIPHKHTECGFPSWFAWQFQREIDLEKKSIKKINTILADKHYQEYIAKSFRKRAFDYKKIEDGYLLTLDPKNIGEATDGTMALDFIAYLINNYNESQESLCAKITLDFYGYNNDKREVFQIPEIITFILEARKKLPHFFYYINFSSTINHKLMLLPIVIRHTVIESGENISIKYDLQSYKNFLTTEPEIWYQFMATHKILNINLALNNIKIILT